MTDLFSRVKEAAPVLEALVTCWLADGLRHGSEWIARNPRRSMSDGRVS